MPNPRSPGQRLAIAAAVLCAFCLIVIGGISAASALMLRTDTTTGTFTHPISGVLINTSNGSVTLVPGRPGAVSVTQHLRWSFARPQPITTWEGQTLVLSGRCKGDPVLTGWDCAVSFRLSVPPGIAVKVATSNGAVSLTGMTGPVVVATSNGAVTGTALGSSDVSARTSNGPIRLSFSGAPKTVIARTSNGSVDVGLPPGPTAYQVNTATSNGSRHVDVHTDTNSPNQIRLNTSNGNVSVHYSGVSG